MNEIQSCAVLLYLKQDIAGNDTAAALLHFRPGTAFM